MICAITGEAVQDPVASKKNGYIYEKRIILKYVAEEGKCPISGVDMVESDLISLQVNKVVKPKPASVSSVPGMLSQLQNEWDEHMLEMFTLKQHLDSTRQELSQALYQHDAACRVIATIMRERDEARAMLTSLREQGINVNSVTEQSQINGYPADSAVPMETAEEITTNRLPKLVTDAINAKCAILSGTRRGRKIPEGFTPKDTVASYKMIASHTPHKSDKPGITAVAIQPGNDQAALTESTLLLTGGIDKDALLIERTTGIIQGRLTGHSKKVTNVAFHPQWPSQHILFTASADKTVKVWTGRETDADSTTRKSTKYNFQESLTFTSHSAEVTGIFIHPTGDYAVSTSLDGSWSFLDLEKGSVLCNMKDETASSSKTPQPLLCGQLHPDGLILGTGTEDGQLKIWDIREQANVANIKEHTAGIHSISFSENGYLVATGSADGSVRVWDLRKLKCTKTFTIGDGTESVNSVSFDFTGSYLAIATSQLQVKVVKEWSDIPLSEDTVTAHSKPITAVGWGPLASYLVTTSLDRTVKLYSN